MENLSFLLPNSTPVILQEDKKEEHPLKKQITELVSSKVDAFPLIKEKVDEGKELYTEFKEDKVETVNLQAQEDTDNPNNFLIKNSQPVKVTDWEKIVYGFAKESWILGNLGRIADAKILDWLDNNSEINKNYQEHIQDRVRKDKAKLDEKYHKFAGGKYDDDTLVKISEFATIIADPAYVGLFMTPWGRAALKSYWKFAAFSGVTASVDKMIRDLAQAGEVKPVETAIVGTAATVLGPLGKWGLDSLGKLFPKSSAKTLEKVAQVIENKTKKKYGNIGDRELLNIRQVLVDRDVIKANKLIEAELNFMKKFKITTDKFITSERALLKEYNRISDSKVIKKQIAELAKKKDKLGVEALKRRYYPESGQGIVRRLNEAKNKLTDLETRFGKDRAKYILENQKQFEKIALKIGERNNLILERLAKKDIAFNKYILKPLLAWGTTPALGAVSGATIDAVWGDENGVLEGALIGMTMGATIKAVGASKVLDLAQKNKILGYVWKDNQKLWMQKLREWTAGTLATKLEAFGGHTKAFGFSLMENIDNPMASSSVVRRQYVLQKDWDASIRAMLKPFNAAEREGAVKFLRGNKDKDLLNNKNIVKISQQALRRRQFKADIEYYFPREYNRLAINKNQPLFRLTIETIMRNLGVKESDVAKRAASFIESTRVPGGFKMIDKDLIKSYLTTLSKGESKNLSKKFFKTPLSEHYITERKLNGPYEKVEAVLEKHNFLVNDIEVILSNLGKNSFKSVAFAERFGSHGEFLAPIFRGIKDKYQIAALKPDSKIKNTWSRWASEEGQMITDTIDAYFGRYGQNKAGKIGNGLLGFLSTGSNLAMLNNVFFANLGDFLQGFINSRNTLEWFKGIGRTNWISAKRDKGLSRWMNLHFDPEIRAALKKPLIIKEDVNFKDVTDWMGSGKIGNAFNDVGFTMMGMPWLTSVARRFAFNVGAGDAYSSSRQLFKLLKVGKHDINSRQALELQKHLQRLTISVEEALEAGAYKNYKTAIQNKNVARILTKAGLTTSNRDAIIPQFSNRLLFAQTKNPIVRILAQFTTWAQAKTSQTNKIIQRIENGDVRHLVKLIMAVPVYAGIQQVREFTKYGEVRTEWGERWDEKMKFLLEGFRLTGTMGWLPEIIFGRIMGPGKRENPLMWFPAANFLGNFFHAIQDNVMGRHQASIKKWDKVVMFPIYRRWLKKFWDDKIIEKVYFKDSFEGGTYSPFDKPKRKKKFKLGGEVTELSSEFSLIKTNSAQLTEGVNEAKKLQSLVDLASFNIKKDEVDDEVKRQTFNQGDEVNKKDLAAAAIAGTIAATGVDADITKAVENNIIPEQPEKLDNTFLLKNSESVEVVEAPESEKQKPLFKEKLKESESSNNYSVVNTEGYMGAYQFGKARLDDYKKETGEEFDNKTFVKDKKLQDKVFVWHTNNIQNYITKNKLDNYIGKEINGVPVTLNGLIAVAHLGGNYGMRKFLESNGEYNPSDSVGTSLTDYLNKFK